MSLPERDETDERDAGDRPSRRSFLAMTVALAGTPLLAACGGSGFRPLHGSMGANVSEKIAKIEVAPIPGRVGQRIRNELLFGITRGAEVQPDPLYRLDIATRETVSSALVQLDGNAQRGVFNLDAQFKLIRIADKSVVLEGASYGRASFERFKSIYGNVRALEDAENRAAQTVGQEIKTRLEGYLATT